jgi:exodeoxyribonuclease VII small subunit
MAKKQLTYQKAIEELEDILFKMENDELQIDQLSVQVKRVSELISFCKKKLRDTEKDIENVISE